MNEPTKPSLWNTPVNELTLADHVKITTAITGGFVAVTVAGVVVCVAADKIRSWKAKRRQAKTTESE